MRIAFTSIKALTLRSISKNVATVLDADGVEQKVRLSDVPAHMLPPALNYEPLPVARWGDYVDVTECEHHQDHPSLLVEGQGWYAKCKMDEDEWRRLVILPSAEIPVAMAADQKEACVVEPGDLKSYQKAKRIFNKAVARGGRGADWDEQETLQRFYQDFREEVFDRLVKKYGDWRTLHYKIKEADVKMIISVLARVYFGEARGPARWARAKGYELSYGIQETSTTPEAFKLNVGGSCGVGKNHITISLTRSWLKDQAPQTVNIVEVGRQRCTHPVDCMVFTMAHEFVHFLDVVFNKPPDMKVNTGHSKEWQAAARDLFAIKSKNFRTERFG
jgi:hypothetical protein